MKNKLSLIAYFVFLIAALFYVASVFQFIHKSEIVNTGAVVKNYEEQKSFIFRRIQSFEKVAERIARLITKNTYRNTLTYTMQPQKMLSYRLLF